jgi:hypothetical protein
MSDFPKALYGELLSQGLRARLFELDQALAGHGCPYRLTAQRYAEAREAITKLYWLVKAPELEITPLQVAVDRARDDASFQRFLNDASKPKRKHRGKRA